MYVIAPDVDPNQGLGHAGQRGLLLKKARRLELQIEGETRVVVALPEVGHDHHILSARVASESL
jgi:hypothetical protein